MSQGAPAPAADWHTCFGPAATAKQSPPAATADVAAPCGAGAAPRSSNKETPTLKMEEVLRFCFPEGVEHPHTAARLFMLGRDGPLREGWLWGGPAACRRKLSEYELDTMMKHLEREDIILSVQTAEDKRKWVQSYCSVHLWFWWGRWSALRVRRARWCPRTLVSAQS